MPQEGRDRVATRLHSVAIHLLRRLRVEDGATGLTPARLSALSVLVFGGPTTPSELAAAEQVSGPTMTRLIRDLESEGLVARTPNPEDGRSVVIHATAAAQRILEEGRSRRIRHMRELLEGLSSGDWSVLDRATRLLEQTLSAQRAAAPDREAEQLYAEEHVHRDH